MQGPAEHLLDLEHEELAVDRCDQVRVAETVQVRIGGRFVGI
jgi:hypothetical protein